MRDRLIELLNTVIFPKVGADPAEVVADYLLENGVIVPPVNVGDTVWVYDFMWGLIPCEVDRPYHCFCGQEGSCTFKMNFSNDDIGKTVFLTKEEAEKHLKGGVQE